MGNVITQDFMEFFGDFGLKNSNLSFLSEIIKNVEYKRSRSFFDSDPGSL